MELILNTLAFSKKENNKFFFSLQASFTLVCSGAAWTLVPAFHLYIKK